MTEHPVARIVAALGVACALSACTSRVLHRKDDPTFAQATSITFTQDVSGRMHMPGVDPSVVNEPKELKLIVTNSAEVRRFTSSIRLEKKERCWCLHVHRATFETPKEQIEVSFCPHCFDIVENGGARDYRMPELFFAELLKEIKAQGQAGWLLPQP